MFTTHTQVVNNEDQLVAFLTNRENNNSFVIYKKNQRESLFYLTSYQGKPVLLHTDFHRHPMADDLKNLVASASPALLVLDISKLKRDQEFQRAGGQFNFTNQHRHTLETAKSEVQSFIDAGMLQTLATKQEAAPRRKSLLAFFSRSATPIESTPVVAPSGLKRKI